MCVPWRYTFALAVIVNCLTGLAWAQTALPVEAPRTVTVARDGTGDYTSIQEAVDVARSGDTIRIRAGSYPEDVTVHSKEGLKLVGEGKDQVIILGRERVGVFHIGKWPYGASNIEISGMTINEHGGHAMGIFNGHGILLRDVRINGMLFGQQVRDVRIEHCDIGGSETTGVQLADSQAHLIQNVIHDNDHGVSVAGTSDVRLERNVITRSLFEGVVVRDRARAVLTSNTIVKNGGGVAFLGQTHNKASGNIVSFNKVGFLVADSSRVELDYNAVYNAEGNYQREGTPNIPAPDLKPASDFTGDPRFVDVNRDDFRLRSDTALIKVGGFSYLGALPPAPHSP